MGRASGAIKQTIGACTQIVSLDEFITAVANNGQTFCPAIFGNSVDPKTGDERQRCCNDGWRSQQLFVLDFDGGITPDDVLKRCNYYGILPWLIYHTFSSTSDNPKFRVCFIHIAPIDQMQLASVVIHSLLQLFPEADQSCKDLSRMFYGGRGVVYRDDSAQIELIDCFESALLHTANIDIMTYGRRKEYKDNVRRLCSNMGLAYIDDRPAILSLEIWKGDNTLQSDDLLTSKNETNLVTPYIYIWENQKSLDFGPLKNMVIPRREKMVLLFSENRKTKKLNATSKAAIKRKPKGLTHSIIDNYNYNRACNQCRLLDDFLGSQYWAYHADLFRLLSNLRLIKGGRKLFFDALENRPEYKAHGKIDAMHATEALMSMFNYHPKNCDNGCPYYTECNPTWPNLLSLGKAQKGFKPTRINKTLPLQSLQHAETKLKESYERALNSPNIGHITIIKAPTGLGKTEIYKDNPGALFVVPTHRLKDELEARTNNASLIVVPEPPLSALPKADRMYIDNCHRKGTHSEAISHMIRCCKAQGITALDDYINAINRAQQDGVSAVITHERYLLMGSMFKQKVVVIDEDILELVYKTNRVSLSQLYFLEAYWAQNMHNPDDDEALLEYKEALRTISNSDHNTCFVSPRLSDTTMQQLEHLVLHLDEITTDVLALFRSSFYLVSKRTTKAMTKKLVNYITHRPLPTDGRNTIIFSATFDRNLTLQALGSDNCTFVDIGPVEEMGKVIQASDFSFSRYMFKKNPEVLDTIKSISGDRPIVSYKFLAEKLHVSATFGALRGIDKLAGQDIVVVGTPHRPFETYLLFATALGFIDAGAKVPTSPQWTELERNGVCFNFLAFTNQGHLRDIQFYFLESELMQAIGRARILRNDCQVTVLSNYPIPGAEYCRLAELITNDNIKCKGELP